jgi:rod shape determining protein RodA
MHSADVVQAAHGGRFHARWPDAFDLARGRFRAGTKTARVDRPWYASFNWLLALACVLVTAGGIVFIGSATLHTPSESGEVRNQTIYALLGICLMFGFSFVDYHVWQRWAAPIYAVNVGLLVFILLIGHSALGAQRWISIGSFTFQPSEPAKLSLAVALAALLCRGSYQKLQELLLPLAAVAIPAVLILKQPDLGTTLVIGAILTAELYFGLPNLLDFGIYVGGIVAASAFVLTSEKILKPFQRARLLVFLNPKSDPQGAGWNLNQSKIAVGSGEWFGKGLYKGTQTQLNFVPEHSRDFIFTVVGEEVGFVGALVLIALYVAIVAGALRAVFAARDRFGVLLGVGLVAMLAFHMIVNIGMTIGIMPITGIPLPFMSYGGSSILTNYIAVGILLNIAMQRDRLVFDEGPSANAKALARPLI